MLTRFFSLRLFAVACLVAVPACTQAQGLLDFLRKKFTVAVPPLAGGREADLTPLDAQALIEQLKGISVSPMAEGVAASGSDFMLCDGERARRKAVETSGDKLNVVYEADAEPCIASTYRAAVAEGAKLAGGVGLATFTYTVACPGIQAANVKDVLPKDFFAAGTFRLDGPESECLRRGGGKSAFELESAVSSGVDVTDPRDARKTSRYDAKRSLTIRAPEGGPCVVEKTATGHKLRGRCEHVATARSDAVFSWTEPMRSHVVVRMLLTDVSAETGERFYASGTLELEINGWRGVMRFRDGKEPPEVELARGSERVRVRLNGEFTGAAP